MVAADLSRLVAVFLKAGGDATGAGALDLDERLVGLLARGRAAHPDIDISDDAFVAHVARCAAPVDKGQIDVHAEDLYLCCACLSGHSVAIERLREEYRPVVARYLNRIEHSRHLYEEVEQRLWDAMLVGGDDGPKLATYSGRGHLGGWIGISAQRIALMALRHEQAESRAHHELAAMGRLASDDPELATIKDRYREQFQASIEAALAALDDRDKTLFRMHLVDGLTLECIAKAYGVRHTTVMRWLAKARERVLSKAKIGLRKTLSVSSGDFQSIARLLISGIDLDISRVVSKATDSIDAADNKPSFL